MRAWVKPYGNLATLLGATPGKWVCVQTAPNGDNSYVMLIALIQVLSLNLNESPFFGNSGVPAQQSVQQQAPPDYYVTVIQQQYAQFFQSLQVSRTAANPPTYSVNVSFLNGATLSIDTDDAEV